MKRHLITGTLILGVLALLALWLLVRPLPWARWSADPGLAAWVQAVGSIVAILIAIAVPAAQHLLSERRARQEAQERVQRQHALAVLLVEDFLQLCDSLLAAIHQKRTFGGQPAFPDDTVADWRELSRSIDPSLLPTEALVLLAEARSRLGRIEAAFRDAGGGIAALHSTDGLRDARDAIGRRLEGLRSVRGRRSA